MHVVFIHDFPDTEMLGVSSIAGALHTAGHRASVWIATEEQDPFESLEALEPDVFAFSLIAGAQVGPIALGQFLKRKYPHIPTVIGGPNLVSRPDLAEQDWVDFATDGEGEHLMVELLDALSGGRALESVDGLWFKRAGGLIKNPPRRLTTDLNTLPLPDRSVYYRYPFLKRLSVKRFVAGRGCPFSCTFCHVSAMRVATKGLGTYTRSKSPDRIFAEIKSVQSQAPIKHVHFSDDVFFFKRDWVEEFLTRYPSEVGIPFTANLTANLIDKAMAEKLAEAGCSGLSVGLESGDEELRMKLLNKRISDGVFLQMAGWLQDCGIKLTTNNMIGLPGETLEQALNTVQMNRKMHTNFAKCTIATPLESLPMNAWAQEMGLLDKDYDSNALRLKDTTRPIYRCDEPEAIERLFNLFGMLVDVPLPPAVIKPLVRHGPNRLFKLMNGVDTIRRQRNYYEISTTSGVRMMAHMIRSRRRWAQLAPRLAQG